MEAIIDANDITQKYLFRNKTKRRIRILFIKCVLEQVVRCWQASRDVIIRFIAVCLPTRNCGFGNGALRFLALQIDVRRGISRAFEMLSKFTNPG